MCTIKLRYAAPFGALLLVGLGAAPAAHADTWKERKGSCDDTAFKKPGDTDLAALGRCVRLFEAHASVADLKKAHREKVVEAMKRLHTEGSDVDAHIAWVGLQRLGVPMEPRVRKETAPLAGASEKVAAAPKKDDKPKFSTCPDGKEPGVPEAGEMKKADKIHKKGMKAYGAKDYAGALKEFDGMLDAAPGYYKSLYNVATMSAMTGDKKRAYAMLACLRDVAGPDHLRKLKDARKDADFSSLREDDDFKLLTGYAKILLLDSLPEGRGEDNVSNLKGSIEKLQYEVYAVKPDNNEKTEPHIWYRWTNKVQAYVFSKVIDHPRTLITQMPAELEKRGYDIVISWGDRYEKDKDPVLRIPDPKEADKTLNDISRTEDEILRKPDEYTNKVDEVVGAPEKAADKVGKTVDKAEDILNTPDKVLDKANKVGDKLKKPF